MRLARRFAAECLRRFNTLVVHNYPGVCLLRRIKRQSIFFIFVPPVRHQGLSSAEINAASAARLPECDVYCADMTLVRGSVLRMLVGERAFNRIREQFTVEIESHWSVDETLVKLVSQFIICIYIYISLSLFAALIRFFFCVQCRDIKLSDTRGWVLVRVHEGRADDDADAERAVDEAADESMERDAAAHSFELLLDGKASIADIMTEVEMVRAADGSDDGARSTHARRRFAWQVSKQRPLTEYIALRRRGW